MTATATPETVNAVFRAVHSIKGGAGAFGLDDLVSFAHVFETTLDCVRSNKLEPEPGCPEGHAQVGRRAGRPDQRRPRRRQCRSRPARQAWSANSRHWPTARPQATAFSPPLRQLPQGPPRQLPRPRPQHLLPTTSGFQPIPFSFDDFDFGGEPAEVRRSSGLTTSVFKPKLGALYQGQ